eukprot:COSAG04_NODE_23652_length_334_cov_2.391489_2_plen_52_part_01
MAPWRARVPLGAPYGVLPLVLLALPASVTDRCIALETCLSDLLIPNGPNSKS